MSNFNPLNFIADHAGMNLADAIKEAYEQGKMDAQTQRRTGKWITQQFGSWAECSECHELYDIPIAYSNFCPNCGADMRGEEE